MNTNYLVEIENKYEQFESYAIAKQFYDAYKNVTKVRLVLGIVKKNKVVELSEIV